MDKLSLIFTLEQNFLVNFFRICVSNVRELNADEFMDNLFVCGPPVKDMKNMMKIEGLMQMIFDGIVPDTLSFFEVVTKSDLTYEKHLLKSFISVD